MISLISQQKEICLLGLYLLGHFSSFAGSWSINKIISLLCRRFIHGCSFFPRRNVCTYPSPWRFRYIYVCPHINHPNYLCKLTFLAFEIFSVEFIRQQQPNLLLVFFFIFSAYIKAEQHQQQQNGIWLEAKQSI